MSLHLFEQIAVGRCLVEKSMRSTDFARYPDALGGEWRRAILPVSWYTIPTSAEGRFMLLTSVGWDFCTTRALLADDIAETLRQLATAGAGSVSEIRLATIESLVTAEEFEAANEAFAAGVRLAGGYVITDP